MRLGRSVLSFAALAAIIVVAAGNQACGSSKGDSGFAGGSSGGASPTGDGSGGGTDDDGGGGGGPTIKPTGEAGAAGCDGLKCQQVACPSGTTAVTGTVYEPAGKVPLYNVAVYVPNAKLDDITDGATCDQCGGAGTASGSPIVTALSDETGHFKLENVPAGKNIPLVLQVGKWRRQVVIPEVKACQDNALTDKELTRMPKNAGEGHIPKMALVTGGCDPLGKLFFNMGLDDKEFTDPNGQGRMHVYKGAGDIIGAPGVTGGTAPQAEKSLWTSLAALKRYDIVILSCECDEHNETKSTVAMSAMRNFINGGGRVFATHYHYTWFKNNPEADFKGIANWKPSTSAGGQATYSVEQSFAKGKSFATWLKNVGASSTLGSISLNGTADNVASTSSGAQRWVYDSGSVKYFTFNTPIGQPATAQCGRAVFSDIHVSGSGSTSGDIPGSFGARADLSAQEKALLFLFFDLAACVQPDSEPPKPPPPR